MHGETVKFTNFCVDNTGYIFVGGRMDYYMRILCTI